MMRGALSSTLYTLGATAVCVAIGAKHGVIEVRTERIRDETARTLCAGTLRASDAAVDLAFELGTRIARELGSKK